MALELRDRSFGDTLGASLSLVFNNILFILKYMAFYFFIFLIITGLIGGLLYSLGWFTEILTPGFWDSFVNSTEPEDMFRFMGTFYAIFGILMIPFSIVMSTLMPIVLIDKFQRAYKGNLENRNFGETMKLSFKRFGPFFLAGLLVYLGYAGGYMLLVIPGLIFLTAWSLTFCIVVDEKAKGVEAMKRSWQLTKGHRWEVFGLFFVMNLIFVAVLMVLMFLFGIVIVILVSANVTVAMIAIYSVEVVLMLFMYPVYIALMVVIYYNLKIRKEGFSVEHLAEDFNKELVDEFS